MRKLPLVALVTLLIAAAPASSLAQPELKTEEQKTRVTAAAVPERKAGQAFVDKAAAEKGAVKTPSGAIVTTLKPGTGPSPTASDKVKVHYQGTLMDGTVFDSSVQRGEPITFPLSGVIKCWTEGMQQMKVGGKSRLVCPADTAYGDRGAQRRAGPLVIVDDRDTPPRTGLDGLVGAHREAATASPVPDFPHGKSIAYG